MLRLKAVVGGHGAVLGAKVLITQVRVARVRGEPSVFLCNVCKHPCSILS